MHTQPPYPADRILNLLARLRSRQLDLALKGKVAHSAAYANRARKVRRAAQGQLVKSPC